MSKRINVEYVGLCISAESEAKKKKTNLPNHYNQNIFDLLCVVDKMKEITNELTMSLILIEPWTLIVHFNILHLTERGLFFFKENTVTFSSMYNMQNKQSKFLTAAAGPGSQLVLGREIRCMFTLAYFSRWCFDVPLRRALPRDPWSLLQD